MGLKPNDLDDLISKTISIDEFESKIDNEEAIVVGFKVDDKDPAYDLSRFIEKSAAEILDTEVSPAPDTDGKYVVFVEFSRNSKFTEELLDVLRSMENLSNIKMEEYTFTTYKQKGEYPVTEENLCRKVRLKPSPVEKVNNKLNKAFESFFEGEVYQSVNLSLKMKENNLKGYDTLLKLQRNLNKHPTQIRESISSLTTNEAVVDFNKLRLEKLDLDIKKRIAELWHKKTNILNNYTSIVSNYLRELLETHQELFELLSTSKDQLRVVPGSDSNIDDLIELENDAKNNLADFISNSNEYLNIQLRAKFASLMNELGIYNEVFEDIHNFFYESAVDNIIINDGNIIIEKYNQANKFEVIDILPSNNLFEKYKLDNIPFTVNESARLHARNMYNMLGTGYETNIIKGYLLVTKANTDFALLLKS